MEFNFQNMPKLNETECTWIKDASWCASRLYVSFICLSPNQIVIGFHISIPVIYYSHIFDVVFAVVCCRKKKVNVYIHDAYLFHYKRKQ